jgi:malate dehydrogenase (oxaloacetate-decarboxylating)
MTENNSQMLGSESLELHLTHAGKLESCPTVPLSDRHDLSLAYTPGVGAVCSAIAADPQKAWSHSIKGHTVAVISDGTAVLGLGNIGPLGALPVMEGKAVLFKHFAGLDAWPIVLDVHDSASIVSVIKAISPGFAAINLEDIAAPACFEVEAALQDLGIPVMHDDQHGTAIVVYAALKNAAAVVGKKLDELKVVVNGAGAAGLATSRMLLDADHTGNERVKDLIICDSRGIIHRDRPDLNPYKLALLELANRENLHGHLSEALQGADVFIGVSVAGALTPDLVRLMAPDPIIFAMANPMPEIFPDDAYAAGAAVCGTGRSDLPNQINNALVFPGIFKAAVEQRRPRITPAMKYAAARGLASTVQPQKDAILPDIFNPHLIPAIVEAIAAVP